MSQRDAAAFSQAAVELVDQLHDIVHEEGWDSPAGIAWLLSDEGGDAPPHAALDELAASDLFTVTTRGGTYPQVTLAFSYAGRIYYRAAELQTARQASAEDRPLSADTVARLAQQMVDLPWPADDDPPKKVEWRLDGYEGQTNWGILHLLVLGDEADPATLQQTTPPAVAALDERWGPHAELQASTLPAFDAAAESPDPRSILSALVTAVEGTTILWWRPEVHRVVMMTIREAPQDHLTALLVTIPEMLDGLERTAVRGPAGSWSPADSRQAATAVECTTCDSALVRSDGEPPHDIDIAATIAALHERVVAGRMREVAGDVPLVDMVDLFASDMKYTIVSYLECSECDRLLFWGLCIRGAPIFRHVDHARLATHRWEEVPDRATWTGAASKTKPDGDRPTPAHGHRRGHR